MSRKRDWSEVVIRVYRIVCFGTSIKWVESKPLLIGRDCWWKAAFWVARKRTAWCTWKRNVVPLSTPVPWSTSHHLISKKPGLVRSWLAASKVGHVVLPENTTSVAVKHDLEIPNTHTPDFECDSCYVDTRCIRIKRDREGPCGRRMKCLEAVVTHTITQSQVGSVMHCLTDDYAVLYSGRNAYFRYIVGSIFPSH
jgi:hypothetical protein